MSEIHTLTDEAVAEIAEKAVARFAGRHPEVRRGTVVSEIPAPLRWAAIVASAIMTVSASAGLVWLVTSVSDMAINTLGS